MRRSAEKGIGMAPFAVNLRMTETTLNLEGFENLPGWRDYLSGSLCIVPHNSDVTVHEVTVAPLPGDP